MLNLVFMATIKVDLMLISLRTHHKQLEVVLA